MHLPFSVDVKHINTSTVAKVWRPNTKISSAKLVWM